MKIFETLVSTVRTYCATPLLVAGVFVPIEEDDWCEGMRREPATTIELIDALITQLKVLAAANEYLREHLRIVVVVRDDARAASQRYLDELRELRGAKNA